MAKKTEVAPIYAEQLSSLYIQSNEKKIDLEYALSVYQERFDFPNISKLILGFKQTSLFIYELGNDYAHIVVSPMSKEIMINQRGVPYPKTINEFINMCEIVEAKVIFSDAVRSKIYIGYDNKKLDSRGNETM